MSRKTSNFWTQLNWTFLRAQESLVRMTVPIIMVCGTNAKKYVWVNFMFSLSNGTITVKILENDQVHAADLKMFPDINIDNL